MSSESKAATPEFTNMTWLEKSKNIVIFSSWSCYFFREVDVFLAVFREVGGSVGIGEVGHLGRETSTNLHLLGDQLQTLKTRRWTGPKIATNIGQNKFIIYYPPCHTFSSEFKPPETHWLEDDTFLFCHLAYFLVQFLVQFQGVYVPWSAKWPTHTLKPLTSGL